MTYAQFSCSVIWDSIFKPAFQENYCSDALHSSVSGNTESFSLRANLILLSLSPLELEIYYK